MVVTRIGLEAGPLSQWLYAGLSRAGCEVVLLETRQVKAALSAMVVKTDGVDGPRRHHRAKATAVAQSQGGHPMQISTVGIDLAKRVFQIHGVDQDGNVVLRKQLRWPRSSVSSPSYRRAWWAWRLVGHRTIGRARSQPSAMRCA